MKHTLENLIQFTGDQHLKAEKANLRSFHYDRSGHVVGTTGHVLFATKRLFEIKKSGLTYETEAFEKGDFKVSKTTFPNWQQILPKESARKVTIKIPKWFNHLSTYDDSVTMVLDYEHTDSPFIKIAETIDETSLAFNTKYLSAFAGEYLTFLILNPTSPTIVLDKDTKIDPYSKTLKEDILNEDWFYVLMPIKLDAHESSIVYM